MIHRISLSEYRKNPIPDDQLTGEGLIKAFRNRDLGTGGRTPYHALITHQASVEQLLRLSQRGAHATGFNYRSIAIAVAGNTDERPLAPGQQEKIVETVASLIPYIPGGLGVEGHTNLPGDHKGKRCPGRFFPLEEIEEEALLHLPNGWSAWNRDGCLEWVQGCGWEV